MTIFERFFRGRAPAQSPPPEPHPNSRIRTIERALTQLIPIAEEELRNDPSLRVLVARHTLTLSEAARRIKAHENNDDFTEAFFSSDRITFQISTDKWSDWYAWRRVDDANFVQIHEHSGD